MKLKLYSVGLVLLQALLLLSSGRAGGGPLILAIATLLSVSALCMFLDVGPGRVIFVCSAIVEIIVLACFSFAFGIMFILNLLGGSSDTAIGLLIRLSIAAGIIIYLGFGLGITRPRNTQRPEPP